MLVYGDRIQVRKKVKKPPLADHCKNDDNDDNDNADDDEADEISYMW